MTDPRTHPLTFIERPAGHKGRWCLGDSLGITDTDPRSLEVDTMVQGMVERNASLQDIVAALSEREMTDAEYTASIYSLGWFHCQINGGDEGWSDVK